MTCYDWSPCWENQNSRMIESRMMQRVILPHIIPQISFTRSIEYVGVVRRTTGPIEFKNLRLKSLDKIEPPKVK